MPKYVLIVLLVVGLAAAAYASQVITVCLNVSNPFGGAPSCAPISAANPLPAAF